MERRLILGKILWPDGRNLRGDVELAFGADDNGVEVRGAAFRDGYSKAEFGSGFAQSGRIWCKQFKAKELAARRCVFGWMRRIGAPLNKKRQQAVGIVFQG